MSVVVVGLIGQTPDIERAVDFDRLASSSSRRKMKIHVIERGGRKDGPINQILRIWECYDSSFRDIRHCGFQHEVMSFHSSTNENAA